MPKELTHFSLAEEGRKKVEAALPQAAETLQQNFNLFMVGSIICDSAYYQFPLLSKYKNVSYLSEEIHLPTGNLSVDFLTCLARADIYTNAGKGLSFLSGVVSHYIVDKAYHPLIMHLTGDYCNEGPKERKKAQSLHRFFESLLDLWVMRRLGHPGRDSLHAPDNKDINYEFLKPYLTSFAEAAVPGKGGDLSLHVSKCLYSNLKFELTMSTLYSNKRLRNVLIGINNIVNNSLSPYVSLFYPEETLLKLPFFQESFIYKNPLTGDEIERSVEEITHHAVDEISIAISEIFSNFESWGRPYGKEETLSCFASPMMEINPETQIGNKEELEKSFAAFLGRRSL